MNTSTLADRDRTLNQLILEGKALDGFERYYADEVQMQENTDPATVGKKANRSREEAFFDSVSELHEIKLLTSATGDGVTFSEWVVDLTFKNGKRQRLDQTSVRRWREGKIVHERFYYNAN